MIRIKCECPHMNESQSNNNVARDAGHSDSIRVLERTNLRDGVGWLLQVGTNGSPLCPHCSTPMNLMGDQFENSSCRCWWVGANRGSYDAQVVVNATDEAEAAYLAMRGEEARQIAIRRAEAEVKREEFRVSLQGRKAITRIHFADRGYGVSPKREKDSVEVTIIRCYVRDFSIFNGGNAEVCDVAYPDGSIYFLRMSQLKIQEAQ